MALNRHLRARLRDLGLLQLQPQPISFYRTWVDRAVWFVGVGGGGAAVGFFFVLLVVVLLVEVCLLLLLLLLLFF